MLRAPRRGAAAQKQAAVRHFWAGASQDGAQALRYVHSDTSIMWDHCWLRASQAIRGITAGLEPAKHSVGSLLV
jgi:hypothetical protein